MAGTAAEAGLRARMSPARDAAATPEGMPGSGSQAGAVSIATMIDESAEAIDGAVEHATDRTMAAERTYLETPPTDEDAIVLAAEVERRAEDLTVLAEDASREP